MIFGDGRFEFLQYIFEIQSLIGILDLMLILYL